MQGRAENATTAMIYYSQAALLSPTVHQTCLNNGTMLINAQFDNLKEITLVFSADTNYLLANGNTAAGYSFKGTDPRARVSSIISSAVKQTYISMKQEHQDDYLALWNAFSLSLPDPYNSTTIPVDILVNNYDISKGDPYLESLMFDYSRYLLITSTRSSSLPPNLQGRWSNGIGAAWGG